jgi:hypothetical protein
MRSRFKQHVHVREPNCQLHAVATHDAHGVRHTILTQLITHVYLEAIRTVELLLGTAQV